MLRAVLLYLSQAAWARRIVTRWPLAWRVTSRFVAGERLEDAVEVVRSLNERGFVVTLDHLGEHTSSREEALQATEDILQAIGCIVKEQLQSGISIKLTQVGLGLDDQMCAENLTRIVACAGASGVFVRIDMEDSSTVDQALALYRSMRGHGWDNLGVVIQSYLYRSLADVETLAAEGARIRLCKGAYKEPPEVAFPAKRDVDEQLDRLTEVLVAASVRMGTAALGSDGRVPPVLALASHDPKRIEYARAAADQAGLSKEALEFQMLYGIRRDLQEELRAAGYPVRIYVPYGKEWYPYFVRRLAERPANLWFFVSNFFSR